MAKLGKTDKKLLARALENAGRVSCQTNEARERNSMLKLIRAGLVTMKRKEPFTYETRHFVGNAPYYATHRASIIVAEITDAGRRAIHN